MAWSNSKIFQAFLTDALNNTTAFAIGSDVVKAALFDSSVTPDRTVTSALSAYGAGVWASGGVSDASGWPAAGRTLAGVASSALAGLYTFDANDTVSANNSTTLASVYGALIHDTSLSSPVANQGICFNYFGGLNAVTSGTFTIVWNSSGLFNFTV